MKHLLNTFIFMLFAQFANAQFYGKPPFYFKITANYQKNHKKIKGIIFLKNGDKIEGQIKFRKNTVMIRTQDDNNFRIVQQATQVRLYEVDTNLIEQDYTDYFHLGIGKKLAWYRQLVSGKVSLFDQTTYCNEIPNYVNFNKIILKQDSTYKNIINFWTTSYKTDLVKSLNQLFSKNFKNTDFKSKTDIIRQFRFLSSN